MPRETQTHGDVLVNRLADGTDLNEVWDEITDALSVYNEHRSALANLLSYRTINAADAVAHDVQSELLEEATEFGAPHGIGDPSYLKLGYSFRDHDLALRMSWRHLRDATREQVDNPFTRAFEADNKNVSGTILERLFSNVVRTNEFGHSVYGLYNGDMKPPDHMGRSFAANHTHFLTSLSAALDSQDVEAGIRHIAEHGYGSTQAARFLLLANPNDVEISGITPGARASSKPQARCPSSTSFPAPMPQRGSPTSA
jgi:hypothetical protein